MPTGEGSYVDSVFSTQFFCEPKIALKIKVY